MNYDFMLTDTSSKHILSMPKENYPALQSLSVMKNEEFGIQLIIFGKREYTLVRGNIIDIGWKGLHDKLRVNLEATGTFSDKELPSVDVSNSFFIHLMDFVKDETGNLISDILTHKDSLHCTHPEQAVFIGGRLPADLPCDQVNLQIRVYNSKGYEKEQLCYERNIPISVWDKSLPDIADSGFYLDLWQHPCNWARAYDVSYYSAEHMAIIEQYLKGMSKLGQRVCDLIISDYPWAGQRCYRVKQNHNNLFELNIVRVYREKDGKLSCDFSAMDQYIALAEKYHMAEEINLFGIIGNWDALDFGNPLEDFRDPIRVGYLDLSDGRYAYLTRKSEIKEYLRLVFSHLDALGLWDKTRIISDEPSNVELFQESVALFHEAAEGKKIRLKCAIHDQSFFENYGEHIQSLSLNTCELVNNKESLHRLKRQIENKGGTLTWFSCCFPTPMNIFLKSPLLESRLIGWFTYYMELDGFLRWSYGIWPGNVYENASYKPEKWAAGDMFFVYPGRNGKPLESLRLKNLLYGLQDYSLLKEAEKIKGRNYLERMLSKALGDKDQMTFVPDREVTLHHSLDANVYHNVKKELISVILQKNLSLQRISDAVVNMDEDHILTLIDEALSHGIPPETIYQRGLTEGMLQVTRMFENKQYFVSEVIVCADTLNKGITHLKEKNPVHSNDGPTVVLAVVEGDLHEIGKNIVKIMFDAAGFRVIDMGLNVKASDIVDRALREEADIIGLSTMMTTTMVKMKEVVDRLKEIESESLPRIIIGGGCISKAYSKEIGADGYSANAVEAVKLVQELTKEV